MLFPLFRSHRASGLEAIQDALIVLEEHADRVDSILDHRDAIDPSAKGVALHLLGIDHERLTFKYQGRHFRLTDVHGEVVRPILT